jgi:hypothetical protein
VSITPEDADEDIRRPGRIGADLRRLRARIEGLECIVIALAASTELNEGLADADLTSKQRTFIRRLWAGSTSSGA